MTREELFLKKLVDSTVVTPTPVTRKEKILASLVGTNLPSVSSTDNGKVLIVNEGEWTVGDVPSGSGK